MAGGWGGGKGWGVGKGGRGCSGFEGFGEAVFGELPHLGGEFMVGVVLDEPGELVFCAGGLIGIGDGVDGVFDFVDGATGVFFAEVEVESSGGDESGDVRGVGELEETRDEVGEAVEDHGSVDGGVGWEAAVTDEGLEAGFPGSYEPGVSGAHGVSVAADALRVDVGSL